jgi:hypothetical protein
MYDRLVEVNQYLELGDGKEWFYFATIHGVIFETYDVFGRNRLGKNELEFFSKLGNLRWVESDGKTFSFALTHYEKEEV